MNLNVGKRVKKKFIGPLKMTIEQNKRGIE